MSKHAREPSAHMGEQTPRKHSGVVSDEWTALSRPLRTIMPARQANALGKLSLHTVRDLLYYLPFRIAQRGELVPLAHLNEAEDVTVIAQVIDSSLTQMHSRRGYKLDVLISDGTHTLTLTFFAKSAFPLRHHAFQLSPGTRALFAGKVSSYRGALQLTHPDYEVIRKAHESENNGNEEANFHEKVEDFARPVTIYHATSALPSWKIARAIRSVLASLQPADIPDCMPEYYRHTQDLPTRYRALVWAHNPSNADEFERAQRYFIHEEAFILQSYLLKRRNAIQEEKTACFPPKNDGLLATFDAHLPFALTTSQKEAGEHISRDLSSSIPMNRLLQGDVGSGKTIVAARAMVQVVDSGGQAVLLVPTEVLAYQHYRTFARLLECDALGRIFGSQHTLEILTSKMSAGEYERTALRIASGQAGIIIGTHALLSESVQIPFLGLAVIDEQHRFGVAQRHQLSRGVHTLLMSATPIPRTIALAFFADMDISELTELPSGRAAVHTHLVAGFKKDWMDRLWQRVEEECARGGRVFMVVPKIEHSDETALKPPAPPDNIADMHVFLTTRFPHIPFATVHGRMKSEEKDRAMEEFTSGRAPILLATTVIEVGIDVPEATMMVICDAGQFGLATLHQLRGRIGRGCLEGTCFAVARQEPNEQTMARLEAFASTRDGFALSEADLRLRSEGDLAGERQSGAVSHLRFLHVQDLAHQQIIIQVRHAIEAITAKGDADLLESSAPGLIEEWERVCQAGQYLEQA